MYEFNFLLLFDYMEEKVAQQMENFDLKTAPEHSSLSIRGTELSSAGAQLAKWRSILEDAYDPESNPNGFVNMGTAENVGAVLPFKSPQPLRSKIITKESIVHHAPRHSRLQQ